MKSTSSYVKICIILGFLAITLAWLVILSSWMLNNSWFVFTKDAYSDFGGKESCCPGLYNYGMMIVGIIILLFSSICTYLVNQKLEAIGWSYLALAGVFLFLIGYYHSGTRPHTFVSTWFFIQADIALILVLYSIYRRIKNPLVLTALLAVILAFPIALVVDIVIGWPSAAVIETYGILIIDYGVIIALYSEINSPSS